MCCWGLDCGVCCRSAGREAWQYASPPPPHPAICPPCRIDITVSFLLDKLPGTEIALVAALPRGVSSYSQPTNFTAGFYNQPSSFTAGLNKANAHFR